MSNQEFIERASIVWKPFFNFSKPIFSCLLDFIYPATCLLCGRQLDKNNPVCDMCWKDLLNEVRCISFHDERDFKYLNGKMYFDEVITCWTFTPQIEQLVHLMKYQRGKKIGKILGQVLGESILRDYPRLSEGSLIPVPLYPTRQRERGYNQSVLLARSIAGITKMHCYFDVLIRKRYTKTQTQLSAEERQINVNNAFMVKNSQSILNKPVILIDDIVTTGATMQQCAKQLVHAGAKQVIGLALARPVV